MFPSHDRLLNKLARRGGAKPDLLRKEYELILKIEEAKKDLKRIKEVQQLTSELIKVQYEQHR